MKVFTLMILVAASFTSISVFASESKQIDCYPVRSCPDGSICEYVQLKINVTDNRVTSALSSSGSDPTDFSSAGGRETKHILQYKNRVNIMGRDDSGSPFAATLRLDRLTNDGNYAQVGLYSFYALIPVPLMCK